MWIFSVDFLGPSAPLNEGQKIHSKIHDKTPAKVTRQVKNGVGKSTLQEEGPEDSILVSFNQVTQDKNAGVAYRREGGAKQHPRASLKLVSAKGTLTREPPCP